jgi:hypothetical protein
MTIRESNGSLFLVLICILILSCQTYGQPQEKASGVISQDETVETLKYYLQLRLRNADWNDYSKFITWPDEPSWDCAWVVSKYEIGMPKKEKQKVFVPVVYNRIGQFCYDFEFTPNKKEVTITYELVEQQGVWKVNAPIPDYPDISAEVLLESIKVSGEKPSETVDRRKKYKITARKLLEALGNGGK